MAGKRSGAPHTGFAALFPRVYTERKDVTVQIPIAKVAFRTFGALLALSVLSGCASLGGAPDRDRAKIHLQVAADRAARKEFGAAIEATRKAIDSDPSYEAAYNHMALLYLETKRYEKAEEAFKKALEVQPNYPEVWNNMGVLLNRQGRFREAIPYLEKATQTESYSSPENAFTNLGYSHFRLGDFAKAKMYHQRALDVAPVFCLAHKNLGDVYAKEGNFKKAAQQFEKAVEHCPLFQESEFKLALVMVKLGERAQAKQRLERFVEKHREGPLVERSEHVLKFLK
jgi:type IV pilus assembly protein PilF